jgi:alpha-amylase
VVEIPDFCKVNEGEVCAFFEAPAAWDNTIYCWAWTDSPSDNFTGGSWPGVACEYLGDAKDGNKVWKWTYSGSLTTRPTGIIFNNNGSPQTADLDFVNGGYYNKDGQKGVVTGITNISESATKQALYDLQGRRIGHDMPLKKGIYIKNNKKVLVR